MIPSIDRGGEPCRENRARSTVRAPPPPACETPTLAVEGERFDSTRLYFSRVAFVSSPRTEKVSELADWVNLSAVVMVIVTST